MIAPFVGITHVRSTGQGVRAPSQPAVRVRKRKLPGAACAACAQYKPSHEEGKLS